MFPNTVSYYTNAIRSFTLCIEGSVRLIIASMLYYNLKKITDFISVARSIYNHSETITYRRFLPLGYRTLTLKQIIKELSFFQPKLVMLLLIQHCDNRGHALIDIELSECLI